MLPDFPPSKPAQRIQMAFVAILLLCLLVLALWGR